MKIDSNRTVILNVISTFFIQGVTFLTTPIFSRWLGTEQFGLYSTYISWVKVFSVIFGFSVVEGLATGRYKFKDEYYKFRSSVLLLGSIICLFLCVCIFSLKDDISHIIGFDANMVVLMSIAATFTFVINFSNSAFIYEKKPHYNMIISAIITLSSIGLQMILLYVSPIEKYISMSYGYAIPYVLIGIIVWGFLFFKSPAKLNAVYAKYALYLGIPIVFHLLSQTILSQSDRVMMKSMGISASEIGIYSLYYTLVLVLGIVLNALNASWAPYYYDLLNEKKYDELDVKCKNYIELFSILTIGFILVCREIGYIMGDESYWSGIELVPLLVIGVYFTFMYQFAVNFEFFYRKNYLIAIGTVIGAGINIVLNVVLIPKWGMIGASFATVISYGIMFIIHFIFVKFVLKEWFHLKMKYFIPFIMAIIFTMFLFYYLEKMWYIRWTVGFVIGLFELRRMVKRKNIF